MFGVGPARPTQAARRAGRRPGPQQPGTSAGRRRGTRGAAGGATGGVHRHVAAADGPPEGRDRAQVELPGTRGGDAFLHEVDRRLGEDVAHLSPIGVSTNAQGIPAARHGVDPDAPRRRPLIAWRHGRPAPLCARRENCTVDHTAVAPDLDLLGKGVPSVVPGPEAACRWAAGPGRGTPDDGARPHREWHRPSG